MISWLRAVSQTQPLVIFIDDLHWADLATLELLNYCIRELSDAPILFLGSFRDDELPPNSPLWQTQEEKLTQYIKLSVLTEEHTAELVQKMLRDVQFSPEFIPFFYSATNGNAFFIREMQKHNRVSKQLKMQIFVKIPFERLQVPHQGWTKLIPIQFHRLLQSPP